MTCRYIYETALSLVGEKPDAAGTDDYESRTPVLLSVLFARFARLSEMLSGEAPDRATLSAVSLDDSFPLDCRLYLPVSFALASLLILDELPEISDRLEERAAAYARDAAKEITEITASEVYSHGIY